MIDAEVERLRALRGSALRVRAVARALGENGATLNDPLLKTGAGAAWRIARAVSGRLRAHPYAPFQRDATFAILLRNSVVAKVSALTSADRRHAFEAFDWQLRSLSRELDDARALTRTAELSDIFGRSQSEVRWLLGAVRCAKRGAPCAATPVPALAPAASNTAAASSGRDWPYLAL
jgi:hypothetical protein